MSRLRPGTSIVARLRCMQEREGAPDQPVIMNPMRHNIPAHIRNAGVLTIFKSRLPVLAVALAAKTVHDFVDGQILLKSMIVAACTLTGFQLPMQRTWQT